MHRIRTFAICVALILLGTGVGFAQADPGAQAGSERVIHVIDTDARVVFHDFAGDGPTFGDIGVFRSVDTDVDGNVVGHGVGQVTLLGHGHNSLVATLVFSPGSIALQGEVTGIDTGARSVVAVVGGTKRYAGAQGYAEATQTGDGITDIVIHLQGSSG